MKSSDPTISCPPPLPQCPIVITKTEINCQIDCFGNVGYGELLLEHLLPVIVLSMGKPSRFCILYKIRLIAFTRSLRNGEDRQQCHPLPYHPKMFLVYTRSLVRKTYKGMDNIFLHFPPPYLI